MARGRRHKRLKVQRRALLRSKYFPSKPKFSFTALAIGFCLAAFADEFVGREAKERFESFGEVVGSDEVAEVDTQLVVGVVVVALHRGLFDGAVHALDLPVRPRMIGLGEAVVDAVQKTDPVKSMAAKAGRGSLAILRQIGELDAVVREHGMDPIRDSRDQRLEESRRSLHIGTFDQLHESELRSASMATKR